MMVSVIPSISRILALFRNFRFKALVVWLSDAWWLRMDARALRKDFSAGEADLETFVSVMPSGKMKS